MSFSLPRGGGLLRPVFVVGLPGAPVEQVAASAGSSGQFWADSAGPGVQSRSPISKRLVEHILGLLDCDPEGIHKLPELIPPPIKRVVPTCVKSIKKAGYEDDQAWLYADTRLTLLWKPVHDAFLRGRWIILQEPLAVALQRCLATDSLKMASDDPEFWQAVLLQYQERLHQLCETEHRTQIVWLTKPPAKKGESVDFVRHAMNGKPLALKGSVALVGNSEQLLRSSHGQAIDQYENVIRFNLAPAGGDLAEQVGTKTSVRLVSREISRDKADEVNALQEDCPLICFPGHLRHFDLNQRPVYNLEIHNPEINMVLGKVLGDNYEPSAPWNTPRNGLRMISCLVHAGIVPNLYGFDIEDRETNQHYFDSELQQDKEHSHLPSREYRHLKQLQALGLVRIHA